MTNTYLLVAIKLHNHGNSPDYSISKGLIQSLSFKKQFFFSHLKKLSYSLRGRLNVIFLGKRFLVVNYLELFFFFYHREGQQARNSYHFVKENKCVAQM